MTLIKTQNQTNHNSKNHQSRCKICFKLLIDWKGIKLDKFLNINNFNRGDLDTNSTLTNGEKHSNNNNNNITINNEFKKNEKKKTRSKFKTNIKRIQNNNLVIKKDSYNGDSKTKFYKSKNVLKIINKYLFNNKSSKNDYLNIYNDNFDDEFNSKFNSNFKICRTCFELIKELDNHIIQFNKIRDYLKIKMRKSFKLFKNKRQTTKNQNLSQNLCGILQSHSLTTTGNENLFQKLWKENISNNFNFSDLLNLIKQQNNQNDDNLGLLSKLSKSSNENLDEPIHLKIADSNQIITEQNIDHEKKNVLISPTSTNRRKRKSNFPNRLSNHLTFINKIAVNVDQLENKKESREENEDSNLLNENQQENLKLNQKYSENQSILESSTLKKSRNKTNYKSNNNNNNNIYRDEKIINNKINSILNSSGKNFNLFSDLNVNLSKQKNQSSNNNDLTNYSPKDENETVNIIKKENLEAHNQFKFLEPINDIRNININRLKEEIDNQPNNDINELDLEENENIGENEIYNEPNNQHNYEEFNDTLNEENENDDYDDIEYECDQNMSLSTEHELDQNNNIVLCSSYPKAQSHSKIQNLKNLQTINNFCLSAIKNENKVLSNNNSAILHTNINLDSVNTKHTCNICKKSFKTQNILRQHMRIHTGDKPFVCDICQKAFSQMASLKYHQATHSDDRPYKCDGCSKTFKLKPPFKKHTKECIQMTNNNILLDFSESKLARQQPSSSSSSTSSSSSVLSTNNQSSYHIKNRHEKLSGLINQGDNEQDIDDYE